MDEDKPQRESAAEKWFRWRWHGAARTIRSIRRSRIAGQGPDYHLRLSVRFGVVLVSAAAVLCCLSWVALSALGSSHASSQRVYADGVVTARVTAQLGSALNGAEEELFYGLATADPIARQLAQSRLVSSVIPTVSATIAGLKPLVADNSTQTRLVGQIEARWTTFTRLLAQPALQTRNVRALSTAAAALKGELDPAIAATAQIAQIEAVQARTRQDAARRTYNFDVRMIVLALLASVISAAGLLLWLIRGVVPRTVAYSRFAARLADGDYGGRLESAGSDEIALLGRTLDQVAQRRQVEDRYDRSQAEFSAALQLAESEREARDLLRRHVERSIALSTVTVLNRNNSADRLEAVTALPDGSPLKESLRDAAPRSCLAVRGASVHTRGRDTDPLVRCHVCSGCEGSTTCTPLIVGGEVIGALLVNQDGPLERPELRRVRETVSQAAPVFANLRNLAISQTSAAIDTLTGLPNRRTLEATLKRMVAQASRTNLPLAAIMIDLDHFKQINDQLGHAKGDEVLAGFGAQLPTLLREGDLAARYGGEEFLVLLPATDAFGALAIAEKIRCAVHELRLWQLDRTITISLGVAVLPDQALDASSLERAADRALYLAKNNGRDRIELAVSDTTADQAEPDTSLPLAPRH